MLALGRSASELASLGWKRFKLRAVDGLFDVALLFFATVAGLTLLVAAARRVVAGLEHAFAAWSGVPWIGELAGGALALAVPFAAVVLMRRRTRRDLLARALPPLPDPPQPAAEPTVAANPVAARARKSRKRRRRRS